MDELTVVIKGKTTVGVLEYNTALLVSEAKHLKLSKVKLAMCTDCRMYSSCCSDLKIIIIQNRWL